MEQTARPRVAVFSLGGTIASTDAGADAAHRGVTPQLEANELVAGVPQLSEVAEIESVAFRRVPSGDLTFADLSALASAIELRVAAGAAGVVITQGTDTIEETSFVLDLLVRGPAPVVVTGAMRNPTVAGPDGPANLLAAVQVAVAPAARGLGTVVVANDEIHAARFVRKTHTTSPATFHSPSAGPLGWIIEGRPRIVLRPAALADVVRGSVGDVPAVALLTSVLGDDGRLFSQIGPLGYAGMVLEGLGGGHVPASVMPALGELAQRLPVVLASRTGSGEVLRATYAFAGSESDLLSRGLISAGFLDGAKARVLLSLLLGRGRDLEGVRDAFERINASLTAF